LKEISMYVTGEEDAIPLLAVLLRVKEKQNEKPLEVNVKEDAELLSFLEEILPEFDRERVYASDAKKLVQWYNLLLQKAPEVMQPEPEAEKKEGEDSKEDKNKEEVKAKKEEDTGPSEEKSK